MVSHVHINSTLSVFKTRVLHTNILRCLCAFLNQRFLPFLIIITFIQKNVYSYARMSAPLKAIKSVILEVVF